MVEPAGAALALPLFDSHVHLDDPDLVADGALDALWTGAEAGGLVAAVTAGYGPERDQDAIATLRAGRPLWRAVGLHPWWLAAAQDDAARDRGLITLQEQLGGPGVVALGEIGLDETRKRALGLDGQRAYFRAALQIARRVDLPVVLHIVRWHGHALEVLRDVPPPGGVVHRYGGPAELVTPLCALGMHLSLCTDALRRPERFAAVARAMPADRLVVETDWPLDERPWADALVELRELVVAIAGWRAESAETVAARAVANARRLYRL